MRCKRGRGRESIWASVAGKPDGWPESTVCGHEHRSRAAAERCLRRRVRRGEVEDQNVCRMRRSAYRNLPEVS